MGDEVALVVIQSVVPVVEVFGEVNFFGGPERGFRLLVHLPYLVESTCKPRVTKHKIRVPRRVDTNLMILNGEEHEAVRIFL